MSRGTGRLLALATATFLAAAACGGPGEDRQREGEAGEPKSGGVFKFARPEEPLSWDPIVPSDNGSIWAMMQIYDQLVQINRESTGVEPDIAESWEISEDGLVYTFTLREAQFSNGDPVTAEDVKFSIERSAGPDNAYSFLFTMIESVEVVDERTITITLTRPYAPFLANLSLFTASIVPQKVVQELGDEFGQQPVGSGPFMLQEFRKGQHSILVRNPNYWKEDRPYLDEVQLLFVPDDNARVVQLRSGEVDAINVIPFNQIDSLKQESGIEVLVEPLFRFDTIWLNNEAPPLDDVKVRQALNYGLDKEAINQAVFFGYGEVANHFMPKMPHWSPDVEPYPYDIEKAEELMAESSAPDGFDFTLTVPTGDIDAKQIAEIAKEQWEELGVNVTIQELDVGTAYENFEAGTYEAFAQYIVSDLPDDDELAAIQFDYEAVGGFESFFTRYQSERATELVNAAASTLDENERAELYKELQEVVVEEAPTVALTFTPARNAIRDYVEGFHNLATGWWWLEDVWLDR
ncbi:MAG: ABC transporter substrate-binding protein [Actinomycetota bacterium]